MLAPANRSERACETFIGEVRSFSFTIFVYYGASQQGYAD